MLQVEGCVAVQASLGAPSLQRKSCCNHIRTSKKQTSPRRGDGYLKEGVFVCCMCLCMCVCFGYKFVLWHIYRYVDIKEAKKLLKSTLNRICVTDGAVRFENHLWKLDCVLFRFLISLCLDKMKWYTST